MPTSQAGHGHGVNVLILLISFVTVFAGLACRARSLRCFQATHRMNYGRVLTQECPQETQVAQVHSSALQRCKLLLAGGSWAVQLA